MNKSEDLSKLVERLRVEQRRCWLQGERRQAEEYFHREPRLAEDQEASLDFLYGEYCLREELQEHIDVEEYCQRFPRIATELRLLFDVHRAIDFDQFDALAGERQLADSNDQLDVECPHCKHSIEVSAADGDQGLVCSACGNSFRFSAEPPSSQNVIPLPSLGRFQLIEVVGRGGFGTVYRGRDLQLQRTVAVKLPRSGQFASAEDEERFVREARNVAQLQHPRIVPVFEVGVADGVPYLVSEFVEGETLAELIAARRLGFRQAALLIEQVAEGVEHAHARGVIHRDLKPANIMLTPQGSPRVMDFGLAKRDAGEVTITTDFAVMGTPAYMSPEQAEGKTHQVDGRCDIYSLGVILYQLLTGELPFRGNHRMLLQQVCRDEPRPPRSLNDRIPRDLATICLKAMAREPARRYAAARDLGADLGRFLRGEPIVARPVGPLGRSWRWCKRNAVVASLLASIILILMIGAVGATSGMFIANRLRRESELSATEARANALEAERNASARDQIAKTERAQRQKAEQANRFLVGLFQSADPLGLWDWGFRDKMEDAKSLTAVTLVRRGVSQLQMQAGQPADQAMQPEVRAMMADTLGTVLCSLGEIDEGQQLLESALSYRRAHEQRQPLELAATLHNLGHVRHQLGQFDEAELMCREALRLRQKTLGPDHQLVADSKFALAWTIADMKHAGHDREDDVVELLRDVVAIRKQRQPPDDHKVALSLSMLASVLLGREGKFQTLQGMTALNEAMSIFEKHEGTKSAGLALKAYYESEKARGKDLAGAVRLSREVVDRLEPAFGPQHPMIGLALSNLAGRLRDAGESDEAIAVMRRALAIGRLSPMRYHHKTVAATVEFADHLVQRGAATQNSEQALEYILEAQSLYEEAVQNLSNNPVPNVEHHLEAIRQRLEAAHVAADKYSPAKAP